MATQPIPVDMETEQEEAVEREAVDLSVPLVLWMNPRRWRWTREKFERAAELGLFGPEEKLELIEGEVIEKTPQNCPHVTGVNLQQEALRVAFPSGHVVRVQQPLAIGEGSLPEPDIAIVTGSIRDYEAAHPATAVLVVEVSDTTLAFDRMKAGLYARAGVLEYWILNLLDRVLEVHREPAPMADQPFGHHYHNITRNPENETISPLAAPNATILIADLLPRARPAASA